MKLEVKALSKKYGDFQALKALNVEFTEGVYGILGPNGAGKSTFMNLLTDNLKRTGGEICLNGTEILSMGKAYREKLGYMPQQQGFYEQFSAMEFLRYIGKLKGLKGKRLNAQIEELLEKVNLYEQRHRPIGSFSGGMRQRVLLAQALLREPEIIIMDEPTAGLDPKERINIRNIVAEISKNRIVFIATHVVSDIECIANKVLLLKNGNLVRMESPAELIASVRGKVGEIPCSRKELKNLQEQYIIGNAIQRQEGLVLRVVGDLLPPDANVIEDNLTLEDVYLYYLEQS